MSESVSVGVGVAEVEDLTSRLDREEGLGMDRSLSLWQSS
jgi:hypothetical protein